jgi:predicted secreted protein
MYKLDKRPSCDKVDVQTWQTPIMWQGRCTSTSTLSHDGCLSSLYIYLVTWWAFVKFVHLLCQMYKLDKHPPCDKVDVQTWQTPIMCQGRCTNLTNTRLSSLFIYLVKWWVFFKFVHLPCHMMGACQVCTSTLSHDNLTNTHHVTR